ncbi:MAG TPA: glycosyltransferase, partial [Bacteroidales bacterium]|nr:glycosyltransferase [Bacteroidales bacterium]
METLDKEKQKSEPMNVLHVFGRMVRGGAEMRTLELMRHIDKKKCRFYFCALSGLPGELDEEICSLGGEVFHIKFNPLFFWRLRKVCHFYHIDVVHSHVHYFSGLILYFGKLLKVPVRVAHFRSMQDGREKSIRRRMQNRLMKFLINRHATNILAVSEGAMVSAWGEDWKADTRCRVIYNGLDIAGFGGIADCEGVRMDLGLPRDARLFIHVGRMTRAKNHVRLLSIFKNISDCDADAFLILVGRRSEPINTIIQKLVEEFKISQK